MSHTPAKPGRPGQHNGKRLRWRAVVRATRASNRDAVAKIADAEIAMKERLVRTQRRAIVIGQLVRAVLVGVALGAVLLVRCAL